VSWFRLRFAAVLAIALAPWFASEAAAFPTTCGAMWSSYQNTATVTVPADIFWGQHFHIGYSSYIYGDGQGNRVSLPTSFMDGPALPSDNNPSGPAYSSSWAIYDIVPPGSVSADLPGTLIPGNHYFRGNDGSWTTSCVTTVSKNDTATALALSTNALAYGDAALVTATVAAWTRPTGTVTFSARGSAFATTPLARGPASGSIAVGDAHACSVTSSGGVTCWGANGSGQIGDGTAVPRSTPTTVTGPTNIVAVAAGNAHSCALDGGGGLACWGDDGHGQLGDGGTTTQVAPVTIAASGFTAIAAGANHTCAVTTGRTVTCWGDNGQGQIGSSLASNSSTPVAVAGFPGNATAVSAGGDHSCALIADGSVWCWGANGHGELGDGTTTSRATAAQVSGLGGVVAISAGATHTCALDMTGAILCWGSDGHGELGDGGTTDRPSAATISGLTGMTAVAAGNGHSCAVDANGAAVCWGAGTSGQLGNGATTDQPAPVSVNGLPEQISPFQLHEHSGPSYTAGVAAIVAGNGRSYVVTDVGAVRGFGANGDGGLGDGTSTDRSSPSVITDYVATRVAAVATTWWPQLSPYHYPVTAAYDGDGYRSTSTSATQDMVVSAAPTTTTLALSSNDVAIGTAVELTATVSKPATESIEFVDGETSLGTAPIAGGKAKITVSDFALGSHSLTAIYAGNTFYLGSTSSPTTLTVGLIGTSLSLATSAASATAGTSVTFTATVSPSDATGSVTFSDGVGRPIGSGIISSGVATLTTSALSPGSHTIFAGYAGDGTHDASGSSVSQTIVKATTSLGLAADATSVARGQSVTLTATASPASATGGVGFYDDAGKIGSATLSSGSAHLTLSSLAVGTHTLTATYSGDTNDTAATSAAVTVTVTQGETSTVVTADQTTVLPGATVAFTATTAVTAPAVGTADGSVDFAEGSDTFATVALAAGTAAQSRTFTTSGPHVVKATYGGSSDWTGSNGSASVTVDARLGNPLRVNATTAGLQDGAAAAGLANGGLVVVWSSAGQDGSGRGVYGQLFTAAGVKKGGEFRINTTTAGNQTAARVAALATGGFVVVWQAQDAAGSGITMRRYAAAGTAAGPEIAVNTTTAGDQAAPAVAALASGDIVVVWQSPVPSTSRTMIRARIFSPLGAARGGEFRADTADITAQTTPVVDAIGGGFVVAWASTGSTAAHNGIRGQRFGTAGAKIGKEFAISTAAATQSRPAIAGTADGGFVAAWSSFGQTGGTSSVYAQRFTAKGARAGGETRINTAVDADHIGPSVAAFPGGGHFVAWTRRTAATVATVRWRRYHADGTASDIEQVATVTGVTWATGPTAVVATDLAFAVGFTGGGGTGNTEIWLQRFGLAAAAP